MRETPSILPRSRTWWLGLALLLLLAGWFYLRGYNVSLPFIEHPDEPQHNLAAQTIIDTGSARSVSLEAYPPGIISLNYLLLKHFKPVEAHHATVLPALRLMTIAGWMLVVVLIAILGAMLAHPLTGLMAAAIWIVNPWVVQRAHFALPDAYVTLFTLLGLWLALVGCLHGRRGFSAVAVYNILLATVFKTQAVFVAPLVVLLPLLGYLRGTWRRPDALRQVFWNSIRFSIFLFWLLLLYPTLEADGIPFWVASTSSLSLPSLQVVWRNLSAVMLTFQSLIGWLGVALAGALLWRCRQRVNAPAILALALAALAWLLGVSLFGKQGLRQFFVLGAFLALLYGLGLTALIFVAETVAARLHVSPLTPQLKRQLARGAVACLLVIGLLPAYQASDALAHDFSLPDRRNDLMRYMDASLPPGRYISDYDNHKTFNRAWGGYDGDHDFPWYPEYVQLDERPIADWRELGIEYAIMPHWRMLINPDIYYPDATVRFKTYPVDSSFRGPDMVVLRLYPMQYEADAEAGPIRLVGYDLNATQLHAGEDLVFRHYWQAKQTTENPHHVFNHLLNAAGEIVAQADYTPLWDERRPTSSWDDPDETLFGREFTLSTPADMPAGKYRLVSGFYDPLTGQRLIAADGSDRILVSEISVLPREG